MSLTPHITQHASARGLRWKFKSIYKYMSIWNEQSKLTILDATSRDSRPAWGCRRCRRCQAKPARLPLALGPRRTYLCGATGPKKDRRSGPVKIGNIRLDASEGHLWSVCCSSWLKVENSRL
ncbi:hypothetical protein RRG08_039104 [Elysia crispata]|uniref:Uncharacterized protein n=1 Tax=Elysia crispata TaxID=231223 RepID=A0AAE0ZPM7_9GAST|nr:hypothetical protein RRG08_039104 [Elysia crispata]